MNPPKRCNKQEYVNNNKAKTRKKTREEEKIWFNKTVESEIKIRKMYNRQKRVEEDKQKKNILEKKYKKEKLKT